MSEVYDSIAKGLHEAIDDAREGEKLSYDSCVSMEELMVELGVTQDGLDKMPEVEFDDND